MTPYEMLYIILANMDYPDTLNGYQVNYYRSFGEADLIFPDEDTIENKILFMRDFIKKHYQLLFKNIYIDDNIQHYEVEKVLTLFDVEDIK